MLLYKNAISQLPFYQLITLFQATHPNMCYSAPKYTPGYVLQCTRPPPFRDRKCATVSTFRTAPPKKLKKWGQLFVIGVVCPNPPHPLHTHNKKTLWAHPLPPSGGGGLHPRLPTHSHNPKPLPLPSSPKKNKPPAKGRLTLLNSLNSKKENPVLLLWGGEGERAVSSILRGSSQPERVPLNPIYRGRSTPARVEWPPMLKVGPHTTPDFCLYGGSGPKFHAIKGVGWYPFNPRIWISL